MSQTNDTQAENPWSNEQLLRELYIGKGLSTREIGERLGCSYVSVLYWMDKHGIERRDGVQPDYPELRNEDFMSELHIKQGLDGTEISEIVGCRRSVVYKRLEELGIRRPETRQTTPDELKDEAILRSLYWDEGLYIKEIAERLECGWNTVWRWLEKHDIERRDGGGTDLSGPVNPLWEGGPRPYGSNWARQRKKAIERDKAECQECGLSRERHQEIYDRDITVHHIQPLRSFDDIEQGANDLDNLVTLCYDCHSNWERCSPLRPA